jgi:hypothetical protein
MSESKAITNTTPPDPEKMNDERAAWADAALQHFALTTGVDHDDMLADLLCDLMHWADRNGFDFNAEVSRARMHYEAETATDGADEHREVQTHTSSEPVGPKFKMGRVVATPGALDAQKEARESFLEFLVRHAMGDWGDVCEEDRQENEYSLNRCLRLFSVYHLSNGTKIWIITEADRSMTTVLLPTEY